MSHITLSDTHHGTAMTQARALQRHFQACAFPAGSKVTLPAVLQEAVSRLYEQTIEPDQGEEKQP